MLAVIAVRNVEETKLAWALIDAVAPHLGSRERTPVFVTVGAGDTFATIRILLNLLSDNRIPLRTELGQRCRTWLRSYARHEEEQNLRRLIDGCTTRDAMADPARVRTAARQRPSTLIRSGATSA